MTFLTFVRKSALRNKRRAGLTVLSLGASLLLLVVLFTVLDQLTNPDLGDQSALRVVVKRTTSYQDTIPLAYLERIRKVPGVVSAVPMQFGAGYLGEDIETMFPMLAIDHEGFWDMFSEVTVTPAARAAFVGGAATAIAGPDLLSRRGWKIGDTINVSLMGLPLEAPVELTIVGSYEREAHRDILYYRFDYLNRLLGDRNSVVAMWAKVANADAIPAVSAAIDAEFANSAAETRTETEKAFFLGFVSMLGDVKSLIGSIASVIVVTMLLVTASTMAMAIRERTREVGVLKALGYPKGTILMMILGESAFVGLMGSTLAICTAFYFTRVDFRTLTGGLIPEFHVSIPVYLQCLGLGLAIGAVSGAVPAIQASRLTIVEAIKTLE